MPRTRKSQKDWRTIELIVERLESLLADSDTAVKSPDFLFDYTTQTEREVDISLTYHSGRHETVVFFEVRDRKEKGGSEWVEQVNTKSQSLRRKAIMVHTRGFTDPAAKKATQLGITLLTLQQVQMTEWKHWYPIEAIQIEQCIFSPLFVKFYSDLSFEASLDLVLPYREPDIQLIDANNPEKHYSAREFLLKYWINIALNDQTCRVVLDLNAQIMRETDFIDLPLELPITHFLTGGDEEFRPLRGVKFTVFKHVTPEKHVPVQPTFYRYQEVGSEQPVGEIAVCDFEIEGDTFQLDYVVAEDGEGNITHQSRLRKIDK
jgi:hypothetical protein